MPVEFWNVCPEQLPDQRVGNQNVCREGLLIQCGINGVGTVSCLTTGSRRSPVSGVVKPQLCTIMMLDQVKKMSNTLDWSVTL